MKKLFTLGLLSILTNVLFSQSNNCYSNWNYSTPITINSTNSIALDSFEVKLSLNTSALINAGKMQVGGQDIRFTLNDACCAEIPHFIESGINTNATTIWIRVPLIAANSTTIINLIYGNPSAISTSNPANTFSLYEGFDGNSLTGFTSQNCDLGFNVNVNSGSASLNWTDSGILISDKTINTNLPLKVEGNILGASGEWPGLFLFNNTTSLDSEKGYGILNGNSMARISVSGPTSLYCNGHNWASLEFLTSSVVGKWSILWNNNGTQEAEFPNLSNIFSSNNQFTKSNNLKVGIGGIRDGLGSMQIDWIRAIKIAPTALNISTGSETNYTPNVVSIASDSLFICQNQSTNISASSGFNSYNWNTGANTSSITANTAGWYIVTAINQAGCLSKDSTYLTIQNPPAINFGPDITVCASQIQNLAAPANFASYLWNTGDTTVAISPTTSGTYQVIATDADGCSQSDTIQITYLPVPLSTYNISKSAPLNFLFNSVETGMASYLWEFGDGATSTIEDPSHTYTADGTYNVCLTITNAQNCSTKNCISLNTLTFSTNEFAQIDFKLFPNPTTGELNIEIPSEFENGEVSILDLMGRKVFVKNIQNSGIMNIQVSDLVAGSYIIQIKNNNGISTKAFIKK